MEVNLEYYVVETKSKIRRAMLLATSEHSVEEYCKRTGIPYGVRNHVVIRKATAEETKEFESAHSVDRPQHWKPIERAKTADPPLNPKAKSQQHTPSSRKRSGQTIMQLVTQLFKDKPKITWQTMRDEVLKLKPDSKFNQAHHNWYRNKLGLNKEGK